MFAHGFGCDQNMWRFVAPAFEEDYKIVLFDYVGSGKSDLKAYNAGALRAIGRLCARRFGNLRRARAERRDFRRAFGQQMIGVLAAIERPELFKNLIQIVPSPCYINDAAGLHGRF